VANPHPPKLDEKLQNGATYDETDGRRQYVRLLLRAAARDR